MSIETVAFSIQVVLISWVGIIEVKSRVLNSTMLDHPREGVHLVKLGIQELGPCSLEQLAFYMQVVRISWVCIIKS